MTDTKVHENRLRRMAARQGLELRKTKRRDPMALDYGRYRLVDIRTGAEATVPDGDEHGLTLDQAERWLTTARDERTTKGGTSDG
jgi:hypothetical protein